MVEYNRVNFVSGAGPLSLPIGSETTTSIDASKGWRIWSEGASASVVYIESTTPTFAGTVYEIPKALCVLRATKPSGAKK